MKPRQKTSITPVEAVEIGLELMMLKASVAHGQFIPRLELLGYSKHEAERFMRIYRKFHGANNAQILEAVDTVTKLNALRILEDDEIDTLKAGGEVQGITLASINTMTVRELRTAIRGVSVVREPVLLSPVEARLVSTHRDNTRNAQDVPDKRTAAPAVPAPDLFCELPPQAPAPASAPAAPIDLPQATGWHVAALQFVNPMGTWRMACQTVNQGTRHANVTFHPAPARAGYRAGSPLENVDAGRYSSEVRSGEAS